MFLVGWRQGKIAAIDGEAIHTAFRNGSDHPDALIAWTAIDALPESEWSAILEWMREAIR